MGRILLVFLHRNTSEKRRKVFMDFFILLNFPVQSSLSVAGSHMLLNFSANLQFNLLNKKQILSRFVLFYNEHNDLWPYLSCVTQSVFHLSFSFSKRVIYTIYTILLIRILSRVLIKRRFTLRNLITVEISFRLIVLVYYWSSCGTFWAKKKRHKMTKATQLWFKTV